MAHSPKPPTNPLVDQHPVDTLIHVHATLTFLQDYMSKSADAADNNAHDSRIHTGHYALLNMVTQALDYEIDRLDHTNLLTLVK